MRLNIIYVTSLEYLKLVIGCYITKNEDGIIKSFVYDFFKLLLIQQNYNIYRQKLAIIAKFSKNYYYIVNTEQQSIIDKEYKSLVRLLNTTKYKEIFAC